MYGNVSHLVLVLMLGDVPGDAARGGGFMPRSIRKRECQGVYRALKAWRNKTAKAEGRPAYAIARNTQLAELAQAG